MNIYEGLMALTEDESLDGSFFFADRELDGEWYRIFNYHLASYSQWLLPYALESRGITFHRDTKRIVSRPFTKFFNLNENPMTMGLDLSTVVNVWDKMDGSMISTMDISDGSSGVGFWLKTKGALESEQAIAANKLIRTDDYVELYNFCLAHTAIGNTVIMEYIGPLNRIVIPYSKHELTVLGIRNTETGEEVSLTSYEDMSKELHLVKPHNVDDGETFAASIPDMVDIEGFVIQLESGLRFKVKTEWYMKLHFIKDSINSQRRLFEAVVYGTSDDIKAQFWDDPISIGVIEDMENKVFPIYNNMVSTVEDFYNSNKGLDRKEYAIKGTNELPKMLFGLVMNKYVGKVFDYKEIMIKYRKDFGIKEDPIAHD